MSQAFSNYFNSFTSVNSSTLISLAFVFLLVRSPTPLIGELSLDSGALGFRSVEPDAKGRGTATLVGLGVAFTVVPFAELPFATLGVSFAEVQVLDAFAKLTLGC